MSRKGHVRATVCCLLSLCLTFFAACTVSGEGLPSRRPLSGEDRVVIAVIDDGTVNDQQPWTDGYSVAVSEQASPSDHTSQVVSVLVGAGQLNAIQHGAIDILILPIDLSAANQSDELASRLDQALQEEADVILVTVGARHDRSRICERVSRVAAANVILVAAAGNFPSLGADYPARCDSAISIAALDSPGIFSSYSTRLQVDFGMIVKGIKAIDTNGDVSEPGGTSIAAAAAAHAIVGELIERRSITEERLSLLLEPLPNETNN